MVLPAPTLSQAVGEPPKTPAPELSCTGSRSDSTMDEQASAWAGQASLCVHDHGGAAIAIQHGRIA